MHWCPTRGALQIQGDAISRINTMETLEMLGLSLKKNREKKKSYLCVSIMAFFMQPLAFKVP